MADKSKHGWATVEEYLEDELAANGDDGKRMQKVEFRVGRKLKASAAKTAKKKAGFFAEETRAGPVQICSSWHIIKAGICRNGTKQRNGMKEHKVGGGGGGTA